MRLHKEVYEILSAEDLKSIIGGLGGWVTPQDFVTNVNEMISSGMLNYTGSGPYDSGYVSLGGSGGSGSGATFSGFNYGSANGTGANFFNFYNGSGTALSFSIGSAVGSNPAPGVVSWGSGTVSFNNLGLNQGTVRYESNGKWFTIQVNGNQIKLGVGFTF